MYMYSTVGFLGQLLIGILILYVLWDWIPIEFFRRGARGASGGTKLGFW